MNENKPRNDRLVLLVKAADFTPEVNLDFRDWIVKLSVKINPRWFKWVKLILSTKRRTWILIQLCRWINAFISECRRKCLRKVTEDAS